MERKIGLAERLWQLGAEAKTPEVKEAYMIALMWVEDYFREERKQKEKEQQERADSTYELAKALVEMYERAANNPC